MKSTVLFWISTILYYVGSEAEVTIRPDSRPWLGGLGINIGGERIENILLKRTTHNAIF